MNDLHKLQLAVPLSLLVVLAGLSVTPAIAGEGVVVLQREVPARPAIREGSPGHAVTVDTSPDDKVRQAVGQLSNTKPMELDDASFAAISTGNPGSINATSEASGLYDAGLSRYGLPDAGSATGTVHSIAPMLASSVGGAVGTATGQLSSGLTGAGNALSGLGATIMRTSGQ